MEDGQFGRDAQYSSTYGRMYLRPLVFFLNIDAAIIEPSLNIKLALDSLSCWMRVYQLLGHTRQKLHQYTS